MDEYLLTIMEIMNDPDHTQNILNHLKKIEDEMKNRNNDIAMVAFQSASIDATVQDPATELYNEIDGNLPGNKPLKIGGIMLM